MDYDIIMGSPSDLDIIVRRISRGGVPCSEPSCDNDAKWYVSTEVNTGDGSRNSCDDDLADYCDVMWERIS